MAALRFREGAALLALCSCFIGTTSAQAPILLDTDIGTDIDDAFALALILGSPELELVGVTTVAGETQARARLAAKMLWEAGRPNVPVAAGEPGSPQPIDQARWADGFTGPPLTTLKALDLMKREIAHRPGELTLVAIGELTNVAALLRSDPSVGRKIKRLVLMGGAIAHGYGKDLEPAAEWNIKSNPVAAQEVFASGVPILMVPLDVTAMLQLDAAARQRIFTRLTPTTNALALLYHLWNQDTPTLFDPMAIALIIDPSLCELKQLAVKVAASGFTRPVEGGAPNATVGMRTDPAKFFEFYLSRVAPK
jgi:inosine-uridine nucleoside N-ribohydrolase